MLKRILSLLVSLMIFVSLMIPAVGVSANVEVVDISEYIPTMPESLELGNMGNGTGYGIKFEQTAETAWQWRATAAESRDDSLIPTDFMKCTVGPYWGITSGFAKDTTYVLSFQVRNRSKEGVIPNLVYGLFDGAQGGKAQEYKWLGQYAWAQDITSADWTTVKKTFKLDFDGTSSTRLQIGLGAGNTHAQYKDREGFDFRPGAALDILYTSVYIAPESAYDMENELSMTKVMPGAIVKGSAKVVNQIGDMGNLDQAMTYFVTDTNGNVVNGVSVEANENGEYNVIVDNDAKDGEYVITARSSAYNAGKTENLLQKSAVLTVENIDYSDVSVEPEELVLGNSTVIAAQTGATYDYGVAVSKSANLYTFTANDSQTNIPSAITRPGGGIEWKFGNSGIKGDKYVFTVKVKKNNTSDVIPNLVFGLADASMGGAAGGWAWKAQTVYAEEITSSDWQTIACEITIPCDTTANTVAMIGLGAGNSNTEYASRASQFDFRPGASVVVDVDSFKIYKAGVCEIVNTSSSASLLAGGTMTAKAEVVNAAGDKGSLDQTIEYVVLDAETRKKMITDITVIPGEDGTYTVKADENAQAGNYVVVASNYTNGVTLRAGLEFTVENIDKYLNDYTPVMPESIEFGNMGNGTGYGITVDNSAATGYNWRATAASSRSDDQIPSVVAKPAAGLIWNIPAGNIEKDKTYVLSFAVRNKSPEGVTPNVVFGLIDGAQGGKEASWNWLGQYVWAENVEGEDWTTFTKSITPIYNGTANTQLIIGLGTGNTHAQYAGKENFDFRPDAALEIKADANLYLAPEQAYDIMLTSESDTVRAGTTVTLNAGVVNQIGEKGNLSQNFTWAVLNSSRTGVASDVKIVANSDGSADVTIPKNPEDSYIIAAYSTDYEMTESFELKVSDKVSIDNVKVDTNKKKISFDAYNVAKEGFKGSVFVAEYASASNSFVRTERIPFTLTEGNTLDVSLDYTLVPARDNEIRVYIWDGSLRPYAQPVRKENKLVLIGDSITRDGRYQLYLEAFMMTRYPNRKVEIMNAGHDGDTAANFANSHWYKNDVKDKEPASAFITFGTNDASHSLYPDGDADAKAARIAIAKEKLENLVLQLKGDGIEDITLITPVTYDDRDNYNTSDNNVTIVSSKTGYDDAMALVAVNVIDLAQKYNLKVVDTNTVTNDITDAMEAAGSTGEEIFQYDRLHPNTRGHFVIASKIIETLYADDAVVASVDINASNGAYSAENADVSGVTVADGAVSYTYLAKSLPMGVDTAYSQVEERYSDFVNFTDAMNMEIVKITGLADGMYDLAFDGVSLGEYSSEELALGVNIATNPQNPGQISAKEIIDSYIKNLYDIQRVRIFEIVESNLKNAGMFYGKTQEQMFEWVEANEVNYKNSFINNYPNKDAIIEKVNNIRNTASKKSKPVVHNVTITPAAK